jgi:uncharacterized protein (UPF0248 family)
MIPVQEVLHRIQWDPACRGSLFEIGYLDRVAGTIVRVPFGDLHLDPGRPAVLTLHDAEGSVIRIPLHRVRRVWRDGVIFWERRTGDALQSTHGVDPHD